jgi:predicted DNA-binding protein YlxM (UPF0122 family)
MQRTDTALTVEEAGLINDLHDAIDNEKMAGEHVRLAVIAAKDYGFTWAEIADAFGISRQAAQQRFGA